MDLLDELTHKFVYPLWNEKKIEVIDQYFSEDADIRTTFLVGKGPETMRKSAQDTFKAFPIFEMKILDIVQQKNKVTYKWMAWGVHKGKILDIEGTGKKLEFHGIVYGELDLEKKLITQYHSFSNIPQVLYANIGQEAKDPFTNSVLLGHENYEKEISEILFSIAKLTSVRLTRREAECLNYWLRGYSIKETARKLGSLSVKTVQVFRDNIRKKFEVSSYHELFELMQKTGVLSLFLEK